LKKNRVRTVKFSSEEEALISNRARERGMNFSEFVRKAAVKECGVLVNPLPDQVERWTRSVGLRSLLGPDFDLLKKLGPDKEFIRRLKHFLGPALILLMLNICQAQALEIRVLTPGQGTSLTLRNAENVALELELTNVSAPSELLSYVIFHPSSIPPFGEENVWIHFAHVPAALRNQIPQDLYAVRLDGILIYLDLSAPLQDENDVGLENFRLEILGLVENLRAEISHLENSNYKLIENGLLSLENELSDFIASNQADMRQLRSLFESELGHLKIRTARLENSPISQDWLEEFEAKIMGFLADMDLKIQEIEKEEGRAWIALAVIAVLCVPLALHLRKKLRPREEGIPEKGTVTRVPPGGG